MSATDGLFNNLYEQEIASIIRKSLQSGLSPQVPCLSKLYFTKPLCYLETMDHSKPHALIVVSPSIHNWIEFLDMH